MSSQFLTFFLLISTIAIQNLPAATSYPWCVALPVATNEQLQNNINYACKKVDCSPIRPTGSCYYPNTIVEHASYAMNAYYQTQGHTPQACSFNNSGYVISSDPSHGDCRY
ncbi:unnamed protein product [Cochlearia groenlandica]